MQFKVAAVSGNTNSFGLYGMLLINQEGHVYQVAANILNKKKKDVVLEVPVSQAGSPEFCKLGFEIPNRLPDADNETTASVWCDHA